MPSRNDTTALVIAMREGEAGAADSLLPIAYEELRALAAALFAKQSASHTLQPTALVHEAYLRLVDQTAVAWNDRTHFFRVAAKAMRQILVDHARGRGAQKRGGAHQRISLDEVEAATSQDIDLLALDEALNRLAAVDHRLAAVVELRFFAGLSVEEAAATLAVSPRTVEMDWKMAKAWLSKTLSDAL